MVAAAQGGAGIAGLAPVVQLTQKLVAFEGEVQARQVRGETRSFLVARFQAVMQPQACLPVRCGGKDQRAELVTVALGTHVAQLQVGLFIEQHRPAPP